MGGGGSHHETHFTYIDRTAEIIREAQRKEEQRLAEERRLREIAELQRIQQENEALAARERQRFLEEQERIKRAEEERKRIENARLERERQALRVLQARASKHRKALFDYKLGSITGTRNVQVQANEFKKLRIGVFGPTGSGKSCFINTCERAVHQTDKGSVPIATTGSEGTIILEDYLTDMFFRLVDTRGFFNYDHHEGKEMNDILYGRIKSGDFIKRGNDRMKYKSSAEKKAIPFEDWLHAVILVVKANDIRLKNKSLEMYLKPVRDILHSVGMFPITVITHKDTLKNHQECNNALQCAAAATGSSLDHTFFVANYCPNNPGPDVETELQIFEILNCALKASEEYIENAKQKKHEKIEREMNKVLHGKVNKKPDSIVSHAPIGVFLHILHAKHSWKDIDVPTLTELLMDQDVTSLEILAACWIEINTLLPFYVMRAIEADLRKMLMI